MAESEKEPSRATKPANSLGLRAFNATGRDDTTTDIIRPKRDPKVTQRNILLIAVVIVAFIAATFITLERSGLNLNEIFSEEEQSHFGTQKTNEKFDVGN